MKEADSIDLLSKWVGIPISTAFAPSSRVWEPDLRRGRNPDLLRIHDSMAWIVEITENHIKNPCGFGDHGDESPGFAPG
jgi:hypothetical protein